MEWISIEKQPLPKDPVGEQFLALWKGCICLCEWDDDERHFYISMYPSQYTTSMKVAREREGKFTHWCALEKPEDY